MLKAANADWVGRATQVMSNGVMDGLLRRWQSDINQCTGASLVRPSSKAGRGEGKGGGGGKGGGHCAYRGIDVLAPSYTSPPRCLPAYHLASTLPSRRLTSICNAQSCSALMKYLRCNLL